MERIAFIAVWRFEVVQGAGCGDCCNYHHHHIISAYIYIDYSHVHVCVRKFSVRFQVLTAASMKTTAFRDTAPCSVVTVDRPFTGAYCTHRRPDDGSSMRYPRAFNVSLNHNMYCGSYFISFPWNSSAALLNSCNNLLFCLTCQKYYFVKQMQFQVKTTNTLQFVRRELYFCTLENYCVETHDRDDVQSCLLGYTAV
jgi:hypothetical protein